MMSAATAPTSETARAAIATTLNPRLAPQDLDAERSVLGGVLLDNAQLADLADIISEGDFYLGGHQRIWAAMVALDLRRDPIDVITLADELRRHGHLDAVGGTAYLATLDAYVPTTANLSRYARIVRDAALARELARAGHDIARTAYEQDGEVDELMDRAERMLFSVTDARNQSATLSLRETVKAAFAKLERLYERQSDITGIATGYVELDRMTAGLQPGDLVILAGRPSMGKTALAMNVASHVAVELQQPVAVFSLEMSADQLTTRLFASEARVDSQRLRTGRLDERDWPRLAGAADRLYRAPMFIDDTPAASGLEIRAKCRRIAAKHGLALVVVDYLQLMRGRGKTDSSREQEISEISRGLKALAKELHVPVLALSQLNRSLEKREDKRPMMSDLRESGAIEQDADVIMFVYRDEVYDKDTADQGIAEIIIGKQRNGPIGTVRLAFLHSCTRFEDLAEDRP